MMAYKSQASLLAPSESSEQQLITIQKRLHLAWGVFIGFSTMVASIRTDFLTWVSAFLWVALFIIPAIIGFTLFYLPKWQAMPIIIRKNSILSWLGLSWFTLALVPLRIFIDERSLRHPFTPIAFVLGIGYIWFVLRLERQAYNEPDEMFP
jgi:hypothetical protein